MFVVVVVVVESPKAPEYDPEKRLRMQWEACKLIDEQPKDQPLAVRVKGGTSEPQIVVRLNFIVADVARSFFLCVDEVLLATKCGMVSATRAPQVSYIGLGQQDVVSMIKDDQERCGE